MDETTKGRFRHLTTTFRLPNVDGRSREGRRYTALVGALLDYASLPITPASEAIARRAAGLTLLCERLEADLISGRKFDPPNYISVIRAFGRLIDQLGITFDSQIPGDEQDPEAAMVRSMAVYSHSRRRVSKDSGLTVTDWLRKKDAEKRRMRPNGK